MKNVTKYSMSIFLLIFFGCADSAKEAADSTKMVGEGSEAPMADKNIKIAERKLIKDGAVEFNTENLETTRNTVFEAVNKHSCYVSSDKTVKLSGSKRNRIVIRIPADKFDSFLKDATKGVKQFNSKEINVKDVTEQYIDIQARLKTKKELELRYQELFKRAHKISDLLEIEAQMEQLRSDIESIEGRLKYLQNRISYSTLTMTFYEQLPNQNKTTFGRRFKNAFRNGWDNMIWFFVALTNIWPFIIIGFGLITGVIMYRRKNKKIIREK